MSRRALVSSRAETRSHATPDARFAYRHARLEMACAARIVPHAGARVDARALGSRGRLATMIRHPAPKSARRESRTRLAFEPVALIAPSHPSRASSRRRGSNLVAAALPETIFSVGTVAVLPLYGMMIGAPRAAVSRRVVCGDGVPIRGGVLVRCAERRRARVVDRVHKRVRRGRGRCRARPHTRLRHPRHGRDGGDGVVAPPLARPLRRAGGVPGRGGERGAGRALLDFVLHVRAVWIPRARADQGVVAETMGGWSGREGAKGCAL